MSDWLIDDSRWVLPDAAAKAMDASRATYEAWVTAVERAGSVLLAHGVPLGDMVRLIEDGVGREEFLAVRGVKVYRVWLEHIDEPPTLRVHGCWLQAGLRAAGLATLARLSEMANAGARVALD